MGTTTKKVSQKIIEMNNSSRLRNKVTVKSTSFFNSQSNGHNSFLEKLKPQLEPYSTRYRTSKAGIFVPTGVDGVEPVTEMMVIHDLMAKLHLIADGIVDSFPAASMYREGIVRSFCQRSLLVQCWLQEDAVFDHVESLCFWAKETGIILHQKNMTVMIDTPQESLMVLVTC